MPEGDSIRHDLQMLKPVLEGRVVDDIWFGKLRGHVPRAGQHIEKVVAVGKHLLIHFDRHLTLDVHRGMTGFWRVLPVGLSPAPSPKLRIRIATDGGQALCYAAPTIQTYLRNAAASPVDHLGPDLSDDVVDFAEVVRRSNDAPAATSLAEALLDQRIACGIGNVYKSEALFVAGLHPFDPMSSLDDKQRRTLWEIGHRQLLANREAGGRRTTTRQGVAGRLYVYGRHHLGCRRCDNAIEYVAAGERGTRSTYWCPSCQPSVVTKAKPHA